MGTLGQDASTCKSRFITATSCSPLGSLGLLEGQTWRRGELGGKAHLIRVTLAGGLSLM